MGHDCWSTRACRCPLSGYAYPNGIATSYTYDTLNRLTQMQSTCSTAAPGCGSPRTVIASYAYTLGAAGNRLSVAELSGRTVNYAYDDLYRLTSETIAGTTSQNGITSYTYDAVGNRTQRNSTVPAIPATGLLNYDANDRSSTDPYDANGSLLSSGAGANVYDFENRLVAAGGVKLVYDGDGNRVRESVASTTTSYLVADQNLTGYAQVLDELQSGSVSRVYSYGLALISQKLTANVQGLSFYGFDGHGSVRFLLSSTGAVTDTYDYDAFGNLIASTGNTPNNYLFASEQFDPALGIYYNRARYYDERLGRFWTLDTYEPFGGDPRELHKYLYTSADPVNRIDPTGNQDVIEEVGALSITVSENAITVVSTQGVIEIVEAPVAVSALQTAVQWALIAVLFGTLLTLKGDNRPPVQEKDKKRPERHAGVLQVQGDDIEKNPPDTSVVLAAGYTYSKDTLSWGWSQPVPLGGLTALQRLSGFVTIPGLLSETQIGRRKSAFIAASQYIKNTMVAGGTGPIIKIFNANDPRVPNARVDIQVYAGRAFVPGP